MTSMFTSKTNFTGGELSHDLLGRVDLRAYENGALALQNVFISSTGGVRRRPGLRFHAALNGAGRLIAYEKNPAEAYLILLQDGQTRIYRNGALQATLATPWTAAQITAVRWCQGTDCLYLTHPDVAPQKISGAGESWAVAPFVFVTEDACLLQPYHKFQADETTIAATGCGGTITLTASADVFAATHVGRQFKILDGYAQITAVTNAATAQAVVKKQLKEGEANATPLPATRSWGEPAFSNERGWPTCAAFYQSRLVFGGSRELPNHLWFSQSGDFGNFEVGSSYDAEAIAFNILSDQSNAICALFAGRHLQIFTTSSEWMVSGDPLTPTNIQLRRQTQVGSPSERFVPPIGIDGATIFPAASGSEIREFLFADIEQAYQATDLSLLSRHLIANPQDQAYDKHRRLAYIIMADGKMATLTSFRVEDIQAWCAQETQGLFVSVAVCGGAAWFVVRRGDAYFLESFDEAVCTDASVRHSLPEAADTLTELDHLEGESVQIKADNIVLPNAVVADGAVRLPYPAQTIEAGLAFAHLIVPLPPLVGATNGPAPASSARLIRAVFRVVDTETLEVDAGEGPRQEMTQPLGLYQLDTTPQPQTRDVVVRALGWRRIPTEPLWQIVGGLPKPFQLVSVTSDIQIGG